MDFVPMLYSI
jgi:hypothetical protein